MSLPTTSLKLWSFISCGWTLFHCSKISTSTLQTSSPPFCSKDVAFSIVSVTHSRSWNSSVSFFRSRCGWLALHPLLLLLLLLPLMLLILQHMLFWLGRWMLVVVMLEQMSTAAEEDKLLWWTLGPSNLVVIFGLAALKAINGLAFRPPVEPFSIRVWRTNND